MKSLLVFILCGLMFGATGAWLIKNTLANRPSPHNTSNFFSFADAVDNAAPSVVNIYTRKNTSQAQNSTNNNADYDPRKSRIKEHQELSLGSGVIMRSDGYIVTNYHVIQDATEILVLLHDGRKTLAHVIGIDKSTDLAVLKIDLTNLKSINICDIDKLRIGDLVLAIGNPYGFSQTVTSGIISGKGRYGLNLNTYENFIQTDAAINAGSSGGALVNQEGQLIGINTAMHSQSGGSQGIGLAIPLDITEKVLTDIINHGHVIRGWLGLEVANNDARIAKRLQLKQNTGIVITDTYANGPADKAGLKVDDILVHINHKTIDSSHKGLLEVANLIPGTMIDIGIIRAEKSFNIRTIIGTRPRK